MFLHLDCSNTAWVDGNASVVALYRLSRDYVHHYFDLNVYAMVVCENELFPIVSSSESGRLYYRNIAFFPAIQVKVLR